MKAFDVGIVAVAILLVAPGVDFGIAQAGGADWNLEALDSYFEYVPENRPVLSFEDQEAPQVATSRTEDMQLGNPIETGSLPSEINSNSPIIEISGSKYRVGVDTAP